MNMDFDDEWRGWKLRGNYLISPCGDRMTPGRVAGLAWRDSLELRRAGFASRRKAEAGKRGQQYGPKIKVVIIELAEYRTCFSHESRSRFASAQVLPPTGNTWPTAPPRPSVPAIRDKYADS